jgi:hypothetical protein
VRANASGVRTSGGRAGGRAGRTNGRAGQDEVTRSCGLNGETRGGAALGKHWRLGCLLRFCLVVGLCQKAVWYRIGVAVEADDLTSRVDTPSQCAGRVWEVERGEIRPSHAKGVYHSVDIDGKYAESSHAGAVIKVLKGGKKMTSGEISEAIESGKLLKDSAMDIGKATSWILWKLKQKEVVVNA